MSYYEFKLPAKILSGEGALEHVPHELQTLGASRPLLLSDQGLAQVGTVKIVQAALRQGGAKLRNFRFHNRSSACIPATSCYIDDGIPTRLCI